MSRTNIDNQIAARVTGRSDGAAVTNIEKWAGSLVFWVIMIFVLVGFLNALQLTAVSQPLNNLLGQVFAFLPRIGAAVVLLGVAWLIATLAKLLLTRGLQTFGLDDRLNQAGGGSQGGTQQLSISETLGTALYWFIFLLFLIPILNTLGLQQSLRPVENLVGEILSIVPDIIAAILIAGFGWLLATIVRRIVTNLLASTGIDQAGTRFGLRTTGRGQTLSGIIGTIVYVLILIPVAISALTALQIQAISVPAISMLQQILNALPAIFTAALILILAYFLARFVADLVTSILTSIGFDNIFSALGLPATRRRTVPPPPRYPEPGTVPPPTTGQPTVIQPEPRTTAEQLSTRTPSEIVGIIVLVGIMLFAAVTAVNILGIPALTALISGIIVIFGQIISGLIVFAIGLFLANLAFNIIASSGDRQARILAQVARIAIIVFVSALALQQIGIAGDIVNLAFGLLLGAIAVATAIAFGLGSREIAGQQVRELLDSFKQQKNLPPRV